MDTVRSAIREGLRIRRVRVLTDPPSDHQPFARNLALRCNIPAGEDIRVLDEQRSARLDLPPHDFWFFDGQRLVLLEFDAAGSFAQARMLTGGVELDQPAGGPNGRGIRPGGPRTASATDEAIPGRITVAPPKTCRMTPSRGVQRGCSGNRGTDTANPKQPQTSPARLLFATVTGLPVRCANWSPVWRSAVRRAGLPH